MLRSQVIPVNHVYRMEQHVAALDHMESADKMEDETFTTQQRVLADTFGSKKRQKQLQSRAANQVTVQESTSQVLTHAVSSITPNVEMEAEDTILENIRSQVLPAFDETAQKVTDIYSPTAILPLHLHEGLAGAAKRFRNLLKKGGSALTKDFKSETPITTSTFIQNRLLAFAEQERSAADEKDAARLKLLVYLHLMLLFRAGGKNKRKVVGDWDAEMGVDDSVKEHMLHAFTQQKKLGTGADAVTRSVFDSLSEQKLLCYIAIASVLLCNFTLDAEQVDAMSTDLKMMTSDMLKYYAEGGCTVSKVRIHLAAPLKLPKLKKKIERK